MVRKLSENCIPKISQVRFVTFICYLIFSYFRLSWKIWCWTKTVTSRSPTLAFVRRASLLTQPWKPSVELLNTWHLRWAAGNHSCQVKTSHNLDSNSLAKESVSIKNLIVLVTLLSLQCHLKEGWATTSNFTNVTVVYVELRQRDSSKTH